MPRKHTDVSNQTFGKLFVLHCNLPPRKRAFVRCDCGTEFAVGVNSLVSGKTSSCGASECSTRIHHLTGKIFGKLNVVSLASERSKRGDALWICSCSCGVTKRIPGSYLTKGNVDNCGCETSVRRSKRMRKPLRRSFIGYQYKAYSNSAKQRNLEFSLTLDDVENLLFQKCSYCNVDPYATHVRFFIDGSTETISWNGVDRVDSNRGYVKDNCVSCCKICNAAKSDLTLSEFSTWVHRLKENFSHVG